MALGGASESSLWFTDGHACMHGTHFLGGHSCGLELLRLLIFLMGLKVYKCTLGNAEVQQEIKKSLIDKNYQFKILHTSKSRRR